MVKSLRKVVRSKWWCVGVVLFFQLLLVPAATYAAGTGAISQGYESNTDNIDTGALLSLVSTGKNVVEPSDSTNDASIVGVAGNNPLIELSGSGKSTVQVVVSGSTQALVSNINGPVKIGDKITASPVSGIGMRAIKTTEVVGTAQADFASIPTVTKTVVGQNGKNTTIKVGLLPIAVNVGYYSVALPAGSASSLVPPFLQSLANTVAGRQVSPLRVLLAALTVLLGFITVTVMLYVSIRSGIISIGRNPLAENALRKGLVDIAIAAVGVLIAMVIVVSIVLLS